MTLALVAGAFAWRADAAPPHAALGLGLAACAVLAFWLIWGARDRAARAVLGQAMLMEVLDRLPGSVMAVGAGRILYQSPLAAETFGTAVDPLAPLLARAQDDDRAMAEILRLQAAAHVGSSRKAEFSLPTADGGRDWYALSTFMLADAQTRIWVIEDVTPRHAIEDVLRREWETVSDFIDLLPVGCYSADLSGVIRWANLRLAEWLGRKPSELQGQSLEQVLGTTPNPETGWTDIRLPGRGGEVFQAMIAHSVFDDGGETLTRSVVMRDLVSDHQWERALKSAERRFRWLFDDAPVGIAVVEVDGLVSTCNLALQAMLGMDQDALAGRPITNVVVQSQRHAAAEELSKVLAGHVTGTHLEVTLSGRRDIIAQLFVSPTHEDGGISGLIIHFIDATEQRNLEVQFAQSQKMQAMGQLAGGVAHDFNNLLTAMIGFCDLLLQRHGPGDPSFADIMQIKQNANRAASLVRQLLAFSRRQALQPRLLNVTDALAELSILLRRLLGETIELRMSHGRNLGMIRVDPGQFDQVIINLAVNARDAMPGGGSLTIRTFVETLDEPVKRGPETMPAGDYVAIEVADSGTGIPREILSRIFEPFFSTKAVGEGTGLGLSTVYGIVRQTEGFVSVTSEMGQGSAFTIHLPRFEAEAQPAPAPKSPERIHTADAAESPGPEPDLTGNATVLLVEDEAAVRTFGSRALRNKGYLVIEAGSGEQAMDLLHENPGIEVLVSDVVMPGMDGVTLARLVHMERPEIRIVLISGYSEDVARDGIDPAWGFHFLQKPFSLKQLAGAVKQVLTEG